MRSSDASPGPRPVRLAVGIIPLQNFTLTTFSGFIDMLRLAADEGDRSRPNACAWTVLGADRNPVRSSCGIEVQPQETLGSPGPVRLRRRRRRASAAPEGRMLSDAARGFLQAAHRAGVGVIGICTGSLALAEAGSAGRAHAAACPGTTIRTCWSVSRT